MIMLMLALCVPNLNAQTNSDKDIHKQLEEQLINTTLAIRHFFSGGDLKYDADGTLISGGEPGPWTINAYFEPQKISLSNESITLSGKRIYWSFPYLKKTPLLFREAGNTTIEISRSPEQKDLPEIVASLHAVFLKSDESIDALVPPYWTKVAKADFKRGDNFVSYAAVGAWQKLADTRGITGPQIIYSPSPPYLEEARKSRTEGRVMLAITIDENGNAKVTDIVKPLGLGLDESAIKTVEEAWKFSPAMLDGVPIPYISFADIRYNIFDIHIILRFP